MKERAILRRFRRLHRLLSTSLTGERSFGRIFSGQHSSCRSSSSDNSPLCPRSDFSKDASINGLKDRTLGNVPPFDSFVCFRSNSLLLSGSPHFAPFSASFLHCPRPSMASSSHCHYSSFRALSAPFATGRETVHGRVVAQDKSEAHQPWRRSQPKTSEKEDKGSTSELKSNNVKSIHNTHEDELGSQGVESSEKLGWSELGWTSVDVLNWPNAISTARLLCGPVLAWMILHEQWSSALIGLVVAGISDWLDGYVARKMDINSVLGSYLDPVADKFLVGSVVISMAYAGLLHPALVGLIVARDGVLVVGAFVYRAYSLGWQWNHRREFFRIGIGGAGKIEPLFISKVNTVFQLALVGVALSQPALSMEDTYSLVPFLSCSVAATTSMSWGAYAYIYLKNPENLAALRHAPSQKTSRKSASVPLK